MSDPDKPYLDDLGERLQAAKARQQPTPQQVASSALAEGSRHAFGIAATTAVGGGIGWMLDRWLETGPWLFLLFLLLGMAAGFRDLLRAVDREARAQKARRDERDNEG